MTPGKEVNEAVGEAPSRDDIASLEQRAAALRQRIAAPNDQEKLAEIERQLAAAREHDAREKAKARMVDIRRAIGGVNASLEDEQSRANKAKAEYEEAIRRRDDRYRSHVKFRAEALALADRFELPAPPLPSVDPPEGRHLRVREALEKCEHVIRTRRTYEEISGTERYRIITEAGLRPFPPLTPQQQRILEERRRDAEEAARQLAGVEPYVKAVKTTGAF